MELQKRQIGESFFEKNYWKIAHRQNFAPKIFPETPIEPSIHFISLLQENVYLSIPNRGLVA